MIEFIPPQVRVLAVVLVAALLFSAGWVANGWRLDLSHQRELSQIAQAAADHMQEQHQARTVLEARLAALDTAHHQELINAQQTAETLTADLAAARRRLSVRTTACSMPTAASAAGLDDDAGTRADVHPETAAGIFRVAARADECRARLTALQNWARGVTARQ